MSIQNLLILILINEENVTFSAFYVWLYNVRHNKDQSDSERKPAAATSWKGTKEMFYLTTHSTHFIYGYMVSDIW